MRFIAAFFLLALSTQSFAANTSSTQSHIIKAVYFYSMQEPFYTDYQGTLQVQFTQNINWSGAGNCSTSTVVVRNEDTHIISAILAAKMAATPVKLYADDSAKINGECFVRAVGVL